LLAASVWDDKYNHSLIPKEGGGGRQIGGDEGQVRENSRSWNRQRRSGRTCSPKNDPYLTEGGGQESQFNCTSKPSLVREGKTAEKSREILVECRKTERKLESPPHRAQTGA